MSHAQRNSCILFAAALSATAVVRGSESLDLERLVPVPADQRIPISDFFRPQLMEAPKLNAEGTYLAASADVGDRTALLICDLGTMKLHVVSGVGNKDLYGSTWLDGTRILTSWSLDRLYAHGLYVTTVTALGDNYAVEANSATEVIAVPRAARTRPLVWIRQNAYDEGRDLGVVQIDATRNLGRNVDAPVGSPQWRMQQDEIDKYGTRASIVGRFAGPPGLAIAYLPDREGQLAFALTADRGVYTLHRLADRKWVRCPVDLDTIDLIGAGDRADELIVVGPGEAGKPRPVQRLDAATGALGEVLLQDKAYDADSSWLYRHPVTGAVLGLRFVRGRVVTAWFDEAYRKLQALVEASFPGQVVLILGSNDDESRFLVSAYSDRQTATYNLLDVRAHGMKLIKRAQPWIDANRMQPMSQMRFKTRDGHALEAYVTLPAGTSKEHPAPLVVLPHGGPWVRDAWGFHSEVQFLASRGYAVLQPNYRGSPGYDWMFPAADLWAFRKMHDDVTDAVKTVLKTGLIDPRRMAIMGTSFGGYLAVCGAAFEPDLYRCAVTISGVFDWAQVMKESKYDQYTTARFGILQRNLGDPRQHAATFDAISPLRHVDQIKVPVFVAHGSEDTVADVAESRRLIAKLTEYHVPHEVMIVSGEGHGMQYLKNEVALHARIEEFLAQHLAAPPPPAAQTP